MAEMTRRELLQLVSGSGSAVVADRRRVLPRFETASPDQASTSLVNRLLNRAGYGPRWGDREHVAAIGYEAYLESQLDYEGIDDPEVDALMSGLWIYHLPMRSLKYMDEEAVTRQFSAAALLRPVLSKRQLYEAMVEFWSDHFSVYIGAGVPLMLQMKLVEDRDVIRPNALGTFRGLLHASAHSPAMLFYLDNVHNKVYGPEDTPNENYARELLELHTLGVEAGYEQRDVHDVARILTGWGAYTSQPFYGEFRFDPDAHDFGEKVVLGRTFPEGRGAEEVEELLDMLVDRPETKRFVASKLVRRFVNDVPSEPLVTQVAAAWGSDGDIRAMLRVILTSPEFRDIDNNAKLKRPFGLAISMLRGLYATVLTSAADDLAWQLYLMGQLPFGWPAPDGYPDASGYWASSLLPRWNFGNVLVLGWLPGILVPWREIWDQSGASDPAAQLDWVARQLTDQALAPELLGALADFVDQATGWQDREIRKREAVAVILASPSFAWT